MSSLTEARVEGRRRIYLVRHADVSYFSEQGAALDTRAVPLNRVGRAQAEELAETFRGLPIDRAVVSGLTRTRETAELLLAGRDVSIEECAALEEIRPGRMATWAPKLLSSPKELEEFFIGSLSREIRAEDRFLGGEPFGDFVARVVPAFEGLVANPDWRSLLIVAHGGTNRALLGHMLGASLRAMGAIEQDPACVNVIDVNPDLSTQETPSQAAPSQAVPSQADSSRAALSKAPSKTVPPGPRYLVRLLNFTDGAPLKKDIRMTTMEKIFMECRDAILAMAEKGTP